MDEFGNGEFRKIGEGSDLESKVYNIYETTLTVVFGVLTKRVYGRVRTKRDGGFSCL